MDKLIETYKQFKINEAFVYSESWIPKKGEVIESSELSEDGEVFVLKFEGRENEILVPNANKPGPRTSDKVKEKENSETKLNSDMVYKHFISKASDEELEKIIKSISYTDTSDMTRDDLVSTIMSLMD